MPDFQFWMQHRVTDSPSKSSTQVTARLVAETGGHSESMCAVPICIAALLSVPLTVAVKQSVAQPGRADINTAVEQHP